MARVTDQAVSYMQRAHGLDRIEAFHLCRDRAKAVANIEARRREAVDRAIAWYGAVL